MIYLCILILPFLSFLSCTLFGRFIGISGAALLATSAIIFSFFLSLFSFFECVIWGSSCFIFILEWFHSELFIVNWCFYFDPLSTTMLIVVSGVSGLVHLYSTEYMIDDPHLIRFLSYLSLFTGFMLLLVTADNFILMFFGWEGIGLASYLLISFWHTRIQASKSAIKAMLVNRVGDIGLALGICLSFLNFKTVDYNLTFALIPCSLGKCFTFLGINFQVITVISLLIFWGVLGKSAQMPLHIWLPDAMEGPTPVSALIHAATLVVAGVFLIIRCSSLFENTQTTLFIITIIGSFTSFIAASTGLFQNDLKRVIAYSTCSQLGYMIFISGLSHYSVSMFHLANHAVFKALLFLSAGCVIHGLSDEQDLRKMGGLFHLFPVSSIMIFIGSLALIGTPFLTGFYSKDCILELAFANHNFTGNFAYFLGCSAAFCTSFYSFRLFFLAFVNSTNSFKFYIEHAHEASIKMILPLLILALGAIFYGFFTRDLMIGLGSFYFNSVTTNYQNFNMLDSEFLSVIIKNIPFFFTLLGALLSLIFIHCFNVNKKVILNQKLRFKSFYTFLNKKWHFDQVISEWLIIKTMRFAYFCTFQSFDKGVIEQLGPTGFSFTIFYNSLAFQVFFNGLIWRGLFLILISFLGLLTCFLFYFFELLTSINILFLLFIFTFFLVLFFESSFINKKQH